MNNDGNFLSNKITVKVYVKHLKYFLKSKCLNKAYSFCKKCLKTIKLNLVLINP